MKSLDQASPRANRQGCLSYPSGMLEQLIPAPEIFLVRKGSQKFSNPRFNLIPYSAKSFYAMPFGV